MKVDYIYASNRAIFLWAIDRRRYHGWLAEMTIATASKSAATVYQTRSRVRPMAAAMIGYHRRRRPMFQA